MIITGISHSPKRLHERKDLPSAELVYLASKALQSAQATEVYTSLEPGWEMALAQAAMELEINFSVAVPYPRRDEGWSVELRELYNDLLSKATKVHQIGEQESYENRLKCHQWMVDHSDEVVILWDYEFYGHIFNIIDYALQENIPVENYWQDWQSLYSLRRKARYAEPENKKQGARIFGAKKNED